MYYFKKSFSVIQIPLIIVISILLFHANVLAATYTVGTGGTHSTIASAMTDAITAGGSNEIRIQTGTYNENIYQSISGNAGTLNITGGWNSGFTSRNTDYTLTTIDGGSAARVVSINVAGTGFINLTIDGFTLQNGGSNSYGSGINLEVRNESQITIHNNRILNNVSGTENSIVGGGIYAYYDDGTDTGDHILNITDNLIKGNTISSSNGSCSGSGLDIACFQDAVFTITGNIIEENTSTTNYSADGTGLRIYKTGSGTCDFSGNIIRNNTINGTGSRSGIAANIGISGSTVLTLRRNQWTGNTNNGGDSTCDLLISAADTSTLIVSDSLVAGAYDNGACISASGSGCTIRMTNLTIADNIGVGLTTDAFGPGTKSLYNSILYNNGTNYDQLPADSSNNLIGSDPEFVDNINYNYRLRPGSPAINTGANSPSGGLGSLDLDGRDRISKSTVDIGAYEFYPANLSGMMLMLFN